MDDRIQRYPWSVGPFGCNPGDFWLVTVPNGPLLLHVLSMHRFLIIEVMEEDNRLMEFLCVTDDHDKARDARANTDRVRRAMASGYPRGMWGRVLRIPDSIFTSQDVVDHLKEPLSRAAPGQDWYAQLDTSGLTSNPNDEPLHVTDITQQ